MSVIACADFPTSARLAPTHSMSDAPETAMPNDILPDCEPSKADPDGKNGKKIKNTVQTEHGPEESDLYMAYNQIS
jgi:hypothetical protein